MMWLIVSLCFIHWHSSPLLSHRMTQRICPYLAFIAAEHTGEGVEAGIQVSNGRGWIEQCFHCGRTGKPVSGCHVQHSARKISRLNHFGTA